MVIFWLGWLGFAFSAGVWQQSQVIPSSQGAPVSSMAIAQPPWLKMLIPAQHSFSFPLCPPETSAQPDLGKWLRNHAGKGPSSQPTGQLQPLQTHPGCPCQGAVSSLAPTAAALGFGQLDTAQPHRASLHVGELEQLGRLIPVYLLGEQTF